MDFLNIVYDLDHKLAHYIRHMHAYKTEDGRRAEGYTPIPYFWGFLNMENMENIPFRVYLIGNKKAKVYNGVSEEPITIEDWMSGNPSLPGILKPGMNCLFPETVSLFFAINVLDDISRFKNKNGEEIFKNRDLRVEGINYNHRSLMKDRGNAEYGKSTRYILDMTLREAMIRGINLEYNKENNLLKGYRIDYNPNADWRGHYTIVTDGYLIPYTTKSGIRGEIQISRSTKDSHFVEYGANTKDTSNEFEVVPEPIFIPYPMFQSTKKLIEQDKEWQRKREERKREERKREERKREERKRSPTGDISETRKQISNILGKGETSNRGSVKSTRQTKQLKPTRQTRSIRQPKQTRARDPEITKQNQPKRRKSKQPKKKVVTRRRRRRIGGLD